MCKSNLPFWIAFGLWISVVMCKSKKFGPQDEMRSRKPNIVLIITDDQDVELGSMQFMPKSLSILRDGGTYFPHAYSTTPMCCPSRSSILTGLYVHNHNVYTNSDNCSSLTWQATHETRSFAVYLNNAGYRTGFFGKYLNEYNGSYIPPGWREWAGLVRNSRFYNYTISVNGKKVRHGHEYQADYYPDLIVNDTLTFIKRSKQLSASKPVLVVLSFPSPHGPEDSAPQYQNLFMNVSTHRTPSWNYAPNPDKQWILRHTAKMEPIHVKFTDMLHAKRLQTLQSVDDAVFRLYQELQQLGELENTYMLYSSDHGYHLGQFGLVKGKSMPFEFDIKVPFYVRGPGVPQGIMINNVVANIDIAPTLLDMASVDVPPSMDGQSVLKLIAEAQLQLLSGRENVDGSFQRKRTWRDTILIESAGRRQSPSGGRMGPNRKEEKLAMLCSQPEYKPPCQPYQKWICHYDDEFQRWRMSRCSSGKKRCHCLSKNNGLRYRRSPLDCTQLDYRHLNFSDGLRSDPFMRRQHKACINAQIRQLKETIFTLKGIRKVIKHPSRYQSSETDNSASGEHDEQQQKENEKNCVCSDKYGDSFGAFPPVKSDVTVAGRWDGFRRRLKADGRVRRKKTKYPSSCHSDQMNCFTHDNNHWATAPLWTDGPFCFCQNSNNNTYWCTRTVNETHNFLFCEFITGFISYYDLRNDPYQLTNKFRSLQDNIVDQMYDELANLRTCVGTTQCNIPPRNRFYSENG